MKKKRLLTDRTNGVDDAIVASLAKDLQEEIDWEIMRNLMKEVGWRQIETTWDCQSIEDAYDLKEWCTKNLTGHYKGRGREWLFEKERDATMFILRWS